jgi:hypothetical protein
VKTLEWYYIKIQNGFKVGKTLKKIINMLTVNTSLFVLNKRDISIFFQFQFLELFEFKTQFDESDSPVARIARGLTDRVGYLFGGIFSSTEMSAVLTEITKMEPNFNTNDFLKRVQYVIIPNVMESLRIGEMEILKDWCTEVVNYLIFF